MATASTKALRLPTLPTIRDILKMYRLTALKSLSQNFLMEPRLTDRIVRAAGKIEGGHVLEVGPGPGGITRSIIRQGPRHLVVVEKDARFVPSLELLKEATEPHLKMTIVRDDILNFRTDSLFEGLQPTEWTGPKANISLIGNLPFAISTRLLINWLKDISMRRAVWAYGRAGMTLTFQKEVAERIVAPMLDRQRCRLSVMSQTWTKPTLNFLINGKAFLPKPDVDVAVVSFLPLKHARTDAPFDVVEKTMRHLFSMRQKYVRRGIGTLYPDEVRDDLTQRTFDTADVDPVARSFELSNEECLRLAEAYFGLCQENAGLYEYNFRACKKLAANQPSSSSSLADEGVKDGEANELMDADYRW